MSALSSLCEEVRLFIEKLPETPCGEHRLPVWGEGSENAAVMLVGEAPGRYETEQGRPFVGKAGRVLDEFLAGAGLRRSELFVTNAVKYRPYKLSKKGTKSNRTPTAGELRAFAPFLLREIEAVSPRFIVTLGNSPLFALTGQRNIKDVHGRAVPFLGRTLFPLYHPASTVYNKSLVDVYANDMAALAETLRSRGITR